MMSDVSGLLATPVRLALADFPRWAGLVEALEDQCGETVADVLALPPESYGDRRESDMDEAKAAARRAYHAAHAYEHNGTLRRASDRADDLQRIVLLHGTYQVPPIMRRIAPAPNYTGLLVTDAGGISINDVPYDLDGKRLWIVGSLFGSPSSGAWDYGIACAVAQDATPAHLPSWKRWDAGASAARSVALGHLIASGVGALREIGGDGLVSDLLTLHTGLGFARSASELSEMRWRVEDQLVDAVASDGEALRSGLRSLPAPRMLKGHREAEEYAAEVLVALGFERVRTTPLGADGGVDVEGYSVVAQVKMEALPTGRDRLQALYGIAMVEQKRAVFFSLAGYTPQAVDWADKAGIALFEFRFDGSIESSNEAGAQLLRDGA